MACRGVSRDEVQERTGLGGLDPPTGVAWLRRSRSGSGWRARRWVPGLGRDDAVAEGFGESAQVVAEGAEERVEVAQEASLGDELVDGVSELEKEVEGLGDLLRGTVGVLHAVAGVLLVVEAFVFNLPA